ncbi:MAG: pyridoxamine 5'-phosphate oxidase family protein, partial [Oscillospiraceae bacterium]|nr:pyridoxamine 5'-phosphate oxidase family protein [Oscillospiraceae bacterium]
MFRTMRRYRQELSPEVCRQILTRGTTGVLAVCGDDGYPYTIPLNYIYTEGKLYFHGAKTGHKIDAIRRSDK